MYAVTVPPLRDRPEDVVLLRHYAAYFAEALKSDVRGVTSMPRQWQGAQLASENCAIALSGVALAGGPWLDQPISSRIWCRAARASAAFTNVVDAAQRRHIQAVLERSGGQLKKTGNFWAFRTTLWEKMRKLGLATDNCEDF
jgi:DNA-binding NtrC family response regulator